MNSKVTSWVFYFLLLSVDIAAVIFNISTTVALLTRPRDTDSFDGRSVVWLVGRLVCWSVDWSVGLLVGWSVG